MISSGECSMVKSFSLTFLRLRLNLFPYIFSWQCFFFLQSKKMFEAEASIQQNSHFEKAQKIPGKTIEQNL